MSCIKMTLFTNIAQNVAFFEILIYIYIVPAKG